MKTIHTQLSTSVTNQYSFTQRSRLEQSRVEITSPKLDTAAQVSNPGVLSLESEALAAVHYCI